jgi:bifunctional enzyme CysN/CysC
MKLATTQATVTITSVKYSINVNTMAREPSKTLALNGIAVCNIATNKALAFEPYSDSSDLGGFILTDRLSNATVGAGMIHFALRRSHNLPWQTIDIDREAHAAIKHQQPRLLWFTGLSGSGKTTIANLVEKKLHAQGRHTFLLDGDNVRHGLNKDLGFTDADRVENIRRIGEVARLMTDAGLIVLTAFISPFRGERRMVRQLFPEGEFIEVFVDTPLEVAERRDTKGLYEQARRGALKNFTGLDSAYEPPEAPEIRIDTTRLSAEEAAEVIVNALT